MDNIFENFISTFDLRSFIEKYKDADPIDLVFTLKNQFGDHYPFLAEQLKLYKKSIQKLPKFAENYCFYTTKSFEQSGSEALAKFKAKLFHGKAMLDLSGGLGVDDWGFSGSFEKVISLDMNSQLNIIARYNFNKLGINNIERIDTDANEYVKKNHKYDLIYLDADRRVKKEVGKFKLLEDTEPSIMKLKDRLFELTETILLKLSPLIDLTYLIKKLENVSAVYVVSLNNEIKEILAVLIKDTDGSNPMIKAVDISANGTEKKYSAKWKAETTNTFYDINSNSKFFYEPGACLIKSELAKKYAEEKDLSLVAVKCMYFIGDELISDFLGRSFEIIHQGLFGKSAVKKYLDENNITKANVSKRNFPVEVGEIKKLFKLEDGGDEYLFFAQNDKWQKLFFHCRKQKDLAPLSIEERGRGVR